MFKAFQMKYSIREKNHTQLCSLQLDYGILLENIICCERYEMWYER